MTLIRPLSSVLALLALAACQGPVAGAAELEANAARSTRSTAKVVSCDL